MTAHSKEVKMEIIEEGKDYKIVKHGKREYVISKQAAIEVKPGIPEEAVKVTISHNIISQNGFESLTDSIDLLTAVIWKIFIWVCVVVIVVCLADVFGG